MVKMRKPCFVKCPLLFLFIFLPLLSALAQDALIKDLPPFESTDRILILAPHPDDETIGCAGVIQRSLKAGAQVKVVYLTSGDNNIFSILFYNPLLFPIKLISLKHSDFVRLGKQRRQEAIEAMKILGMKEGDLTFLGYPDHGTDKMFLYYWGEKKPYSSTFSGQHSVPYQESEDYKEEYKGDSILRQLKKIILDYKPTKIFVSHTADHNGDHWALYLYLQVVLVDLLDEMPDPEVYPYLIHVPGWPTPHHYHPQMEMSLPPQHFFEDLVSIFDWRELRLTEEEIEKKHRALLAYKSQTRVSAFYLLAFVRQNEIFGDLPLLRLKEQFSSQIPDGGSYNFTTDNQWISFAVADGNLLLKTVKPVELKSRVSYWFFIAGFRHGMYFGDMPNIVVRARNNRVDIYNTVLGDKTVNPEGTGITFGKDHVTLKIPLKILGDPDGMIFAFNSLNNRSFPPGYKAFRRILIQRGRPQENLEDLADKWGAFP